MKTKIKVGDIIRTKEMSRPHRFRLAIVKSIQGWYVAKGLVDVKFRGESTGSLITLSKCTLHTQREKLEKWWLWL